MKYFARNADHQLHVQTLVCQLMSIHHFSSILVHKTPKLGQLPLQKYMLCKHSPYKGAHSFDIQPKNRTLHICDPQTLHSMFACSSSDNIIVVG